MRITRYPTQALSRTFLYSSLVQVALVIAVIVALLVVSLPARIASAARSEAPAAQMEVQLVPPRLTVSLGADGLLESVETKVFLAGKAQPVSIGRSDLEALSKLGIAIPPIGLPAGQVQALQNAGVQHLDVVKGFDGTLDVYINGVFVAGIVLGTEQSNVGTVLGLVEDFTGFPIPLQNVLIPVVLASGADVVLKLPVAGGVQAIPVRAEGAPSGYVPLPKKAAELMAKLVVSYDANGKLQVLGQPLDALVGMPTGTDLPTGVMAIMKKRGLNSLQVKVDNEGLSLNTGGKLLVGFRLGGADALGILGKLSAAYGLPVGGQLSLLNVRDRVDLDLTVNLP